MKLFMIHAGFYDETITGGFYESHTNYFVVADSLTTAKKRARQIEEFKAKKMHIDGIMELTHVDGYSIVLEKSDAQNQSATQTYGYDEVKSL